MGDKTEVTTLWKNEAPKKEEREALPPKSAKHIGAALCAFAATKRDTERQSALPHSQPLSPIPEALQGEIKVHPS